MIKVVARDMIRFYEEQPDTWDLGTWESVQLTGPYLRNDDDLTLAIHEDSLGWRSSMCPEFIWSDITMEYVV